MERSGNGIIFDKSETTDDDAVWLIRMSLAHADESFAEAVESTRPKLNRDSQRIQISSQEARAAVSGLKNFADKLPEGHIGFRQDLVNAAEDIETYL